MSFFRISCSVEELALELRDLCCSLSFEAAHLVLGRRHLILGRQVNPKLAHLENPSTLAELVTVELLRGG